MSNYILKKCEISELDRIVKFYRYVSENTANMNQYGKWSFGLHPKSEQIKNYIRSGFMYYYEINGEILGTAAITPFQGDEYRDIDWKLSCRNDEVSVVHLMAVSPDHQKCGIAKQIMRNVVEIAKNNHSKSVRLDALSCNTPAHRLYQSIGFEKIGICHWYAENVGNTDFYLFEYIL